MKKSATIILTILSAIIILDSVNAGHAFFMFFLAGIIPGTNITLSADSMLQGFGLLIGFTLSRTTRAIMRSVETSDTQPAQSSKGTILSAQS